MSAIADRQFHLYAVKDVDQAIEILTDIDAGLPDEKGHVPQESINHRIVSTMKNLATLRQAFSLPAAKARGKQRER